MPDPTPFPEAGFLARLDALDPAATTLPAAANAPLLESDPATNALRLTEPGQWLLQLLQARRAVLAATHDSAISSDELRRYAKYARPGAPSMHIVTLRRQQAAAKLASGRAQTAFVHAAGGFTRTADIHVPPRATLSTFVLGWIERNIPKLP